MMGEQFNSHEKKRQWILALVALSFLLISIFWLYRDTIVSMIQIWERSETFTHCFLVPPIVLWLIWRKRLEIYSYSPSPNFWMLIPLVFFAFLWILGEITITNSITQIAVVLLIQCSIIFVLGGDVARIIIFPVSFLLFSVPIGEFLLPVLMEWTASFTIFALRLTGIPVYRDGLQFVIPSGNWSVVEACSGVRYLIASLTVGTLFAYLNYQSNKKRLIFVMVSIIVPVFANWLRAYMIVLLGHLSGNTIAVGVDHIIYGWLFFGVVVISMFMIGIRWAENTPSNSIISSAVIFDSHSGSRMLPMCLGVILAFLISSLPIFVATKVNQSLISQTVVLEAPTQLAAGWSLTLNPSMPWKPAFQNPASQVVTAYSNSSIPVGLYVAYYRNQNSDSKLINSENVLVSSQDSQWSSVYSAHKELELSDGSLSVKTTTLKHVSGVVGSSGLQMEVWQYYWINGFVTTNDYVAKMYGAVSKLLGRGDDAAVVVLHVVREPGVDSSAVLTQFLQANYLQIDELLHRTRGDAVAAVPTIGKT